MEENVTKKPITQTIRELMVGESCRFPMEQRPSVTEVCRRYAKANVRIGWSYTLTDNLSSFEVVVTRTR